MVNGYNKSDLVLPYVVVVLLLLLLLSLLLLLLFSKCMGRSGGIRVSLHNSIRIEQQRQPPAFRKCELQGQKKQSFSCNFGRSCAEMDLRVAKKSYSELSWADNVTF